MPSFPFFLVGGLVACLCYSVFLWIFRLFCAALRSGRRIYLVLRVDMLAESNSKSNSRSLLLSRWGRCYEGKMRAVSQPDRRRCVRNDWLVGNQSKVFPWERSVRWLCFSHTVTFVTLLFIAHHLHVPKQGRPSFLVKARSRDSSFPSIVVNGCRFRVSSLREVFLFHCDTLRAYRHKFVFLGHFAKKIPILFIFVKLLLHQIIDFSDCRFKMVWKDA